MCDARIFDEDFSDWTFHLDKTHSAHATLFRRRPQWLSLSSQSPLITVSPFFFSSGSRASHIYLGFHCDFALVGRCVDQYVR